MKYTAQFTPQAWVDDYAIEVDAEGETEWDVTEALSAMSEADRNNAMQPDSYESDDLRHTTDTPEWVKNWDGPFYITVDESEE